MLSVFASELSIYIASSFESNASLERCCKFWAALGTAAEVQKAPPLILTCWYYAERKCCLDRREDGVCVPPSVHLGPEKQPVGHLSHRAISPNTYHSRMNDREQMHGR